MIDTNFDFYSDAGGGDPDSRSPTLRKYHKILWSKPLSNGMVFNLTDAEKGAYLYHNSVLGEFVLGSDAIVHSYRNQKRKKWLTTQIPDDVNELFNSCHNIASYIIFPKNAVDGRQTINQSRGVNKFIDDRFDLTLECIRRLYLNQSSPLYSVLMRYKTFFDLFEDFNGYIDFFFLQDLVDKNTSRVKFYLPFDDFKNQPIFSNTDDYISYKNGVMNFNSNRKSRIEEYVKTYLR
jgi:hypothetical protein